MWSVDPVVAKRMRANLRTGACALDVELDRDEEAWGWRGRTLGRPVTGRGTGWLRLAAKPSRVLDLDIYWTGTITAATQISASVPRPRLQAWHEWSDGDWRYRVELYERARGGPASASAVPTGAIDLPSSWWADVRRALVDTSTVVTSRYTVTQQYLDAAMPRVLGAPIDTRVPHWATAHGDFHLANLCAPALNILDWEGWGMAPVGYDAAMLHAYCLPMPGAAARVRLELDHLLGTSAGHFAQLAVAAELLDVGGHGVSGPLVPFLRMWTERLLNRAIPAGPVHRFGRSAMHGFTPTRSAAAIRDAPSRNARRAIGANPPPRP